MFINKQKRFNSPKPAWNGLTQCRFSFDNRRNSPTLSKSVGSFLPQLTRKAFQKFGFSTTSLIFDWEKIAGSDLASWTMPEEVKWPKNKEQNSISSHARSSAALLILRVDPAHSLEISYSVRQILDRINAYFGYRAISDIRLLSAPLQTEPPPKQKTPTFTNFEQDTGKNILTLEDPLHRALARLKIRLMSTS
ncbi:MAG: DUF721 domain-containing protein [Hyphomicrobium sp.]